MKNNYYNATRVRMRDNYFRSVHQNDGVTDYMIKCINELIQKNGLFNILDLGTGNGYLVKKIVDSNKSKLDVTGIDISKDMINDAIDDKYPELKFLVMDNNKLEFKENNFDLITAKAVSNVSIEEVHRVLKKGGFFVYKEYSSGKGMDNIFKDSGIVPNIGGLDIIAGLYNLNFEYINVQYYKIPVNRTPIDIKNIIKTMNLTNDENSKKLIKTINRHMQDEFIETISDPYLIIAKK